MPHYADKREAQFGDLVVGPTGGSNKNGPTMISGVLVNISPGATSCNGTVVLTGTYHKTNTGQMSFQAPYQGQTACVTLGDMRKVDVFPEPDKVGEAGDPKPVAAA